VKESSSINGISSLRSISIWTGRALSSPLKSLLQSWTKFGLRTNSLQVSSESSNFSPISKQNDFQVRFRSNRSRRGLYGGKDIRTGNNVSFSNRRTRRKFKPNVFKKRVYSETLDEMIQFHLTTSTLRSIDKAGGLDNYLQKTKHLGEKEGPETLKRIMKAKKTAEERAMMNQVKETSEAI